MMTSFNRRIVIWFAIATVLIGALSFAAYHSVRDLVRQNNWVSHTYDVLMLLDDVLVQLKEIQTSLRGYVLTGDVSYLAHFDVSKDVVEQKLGMLSAKVADNPPQAARAKKLEEAARLVVEWAERQGETYRVEGEKAAVAMVRTGIGQQRITAAASIIATMGETENTLMAERRESVRAALIWTALLGMAGLMAILGILMLVFWLISRETRRRARTEQSLQAAVATMEATNTERRQIAQLSEFLQSCRSKQEIHDLLQQNIPNLFPGTHGSIGITSNSRNLIEVVSNWGGETSTVSPFPPDDCWAMRRGKMHVVTYGAPEPDCSHLLTRMPESVCVPLMAHGETLGMLYMATTERAYFSDARLLLLRTVCEQVSLAMANMQLQDTLRMQSLRDPLTQLFNRRYMESSLERELLRARRNAQPLSVLMLDVDHFKRFNDTYGHDAGDALLKEFAKTMIAQVRGEDIACRYGGEEFLLILPGADQKVASARAEQILESMRRIQLRHHQQLIGDITVSIGIALYPAQAEEVEPLVKAADKALYQAKREGRDRYIIAS